MDRRVKRKLIWRPTEFMLTGLAAALLIINVIPLHFSQRISTLSKIEQALEPAAYMTYIFIMGFIFRQA